MDYKKDQKNVHNEIEHVVNEKRLVRVMFLVAILGLLASLILPFVLK